MNTNQQARTTTPISDIAVGVFAGLWLFAASAVLVAGLAAAVILAIANRS